MITPAQRNKLLAAARAARQRAYAPYSKFHVGAAVLDERGRIHVGCNVEYGSFGLGTDVFVASPDAKGHDSLTLHGLLPMQFIYRDPARPPPGRRRSRARRDRD